MKLTTLDSVIRTLTGPSPDQRMEVPDAVRSGALRSLERMFELAE